jgi:hypothetical protein
MCFESIQMLNFFSNEFFHPSPSFLNRASFLAMFGVHECDCVACVQKLTHSDLRPDNRQQLIQMHLSGFYSDEVCCIQKAMEKVARLFDLLEIHTGTTSAEHVVAAVTIDSILTTLADRLMFPA